MEEINQNVLNRINQRSRDVLVLYFGLDEHEKHTHQEIGDIFGVTRVRIGQLVRKGMQAYRRELVAYRKETRVFKFYYHLSCCSSAYTHILSFIEALMKVAQKQDVIRELPFETLNLSTRSLNSIKRYTKVKTVGELERLVLTDEIHNVKHLGDKSIFEVQNLLDSLLT